MVLGLNLVSFFSSFGLELDLALTPLRLGFDSISESPGLGLDHDILDYSPV